jgi:predicted cobalt transporter CbtA
MPYETTLQLVHADHDYYGFAIAAPKHEWPFYASGDGWHTTAVTAASEIVEVVQVDFAAGPIHELVTGEAEIAIDSTLAVNAVRLAGRIGLSAEHTLGPTHALNGDKILPITPVPGADRVRLRWRYRMGAGLGPLELGCEPSAAAARRAA